jgi:hypothetical protein
MKAVVLKEFDGPENLSPGDLPIPSVAPSAVLIRAVAASANPVDVSISKRTPFSPVLPAMHLERNSPMSLQDTLDPFRASFESGDPPYNPPDWIHEAIHRATDESIVSGAAVADPAKTVAIL